MLRPYEIILTNAGDGGRGTDPVHCDPKTMISRDSAIIDRNRDISTPEGIGGWLEVDVII